jgi:arylsulfatase A-like enzyme
VPTDRPNILVIWGDDIGISNVSCYSDGLMGYRTPNIDRIAAEGVRFTTTTASRAARQVGPLLSADRIHIGRD